MYILIAFLLMLPPGPTCGTWPQDRSTKEVRDDTKHRVDEMAKSMGAGADSRRVLRAMLARESSGDPCSVHTQGEGEYGLGPFGLSVRWTLAHWDREADHEVLKIPEVATVIALRIYSRAVKLHGAKTWTEVNSVFATGKIKVRPGKDAKWCARLERYGVDCNAKPEGLGATLGLGKTHDQHEVLESMK